MLRAAEQDLGEIMAVLLNHGAPPEGILIAAQNGSFKACKILIDHECDVEKSDRRKNNPLMIAVENKHNHVARLLFESGCNVNEMNAAGENAFTLGIKTQNHEVVRYFV